MPAKIKTLHEQKKFNISNQPHLEKQIVTSGGVLIYRFGESGMELLLVNSRGGYEDFGGKIDSCDKSIFQTVSRETFEESNQLINIKDLEMRLEFAPYIYIKNSKYVCFIVEATQKESKLESHDFGNFETHENIKRTVKWISLNMFLRPEIIKHKLNWRLKSAALFAKLLEIDNKRKLCVSFF